jgi:general secretion pathway protein L
MSLVRLVLSWLAAWLTLAADGFASLVDATQTRRELRLVEGDDGDFALWRHAGRAGWTVVAEALRVEEGAIVTPLPAKTRALMRRARVEVVLQSRHFLVRILELPAGAAGFLTGVVRTQIDRLTPWRASEAAFGSTAPENLGSDRIAIRVVATARARLTAFAQGFLPYEVDALRVLTDLGDSHAGSEVCVFAETLGATRRVQHLKTSLAAGLGLASVAAMAAVAAWSILGANLDSASDELQASIDQRRAALLAKRGGANEAVNALAERKRATLPTVLALEKLSQILPDKTYLTDLNIDGAKLQIVGLTDDAPGLIRLIEQSRQFSHAAFFEPTTRGPNETGARFHVEAHIEPNWAHTP